MTFRKRDFPNPSASSSKDEAFSCFGIGRVHQNPGNEKGGIGRPSLLKALSRKSKNPAGFFSCLGPEGPQHQT
jgi:hypothetical protein